jgi:beta-phosphoglucomutase-like phosphatase (HAD superfamily)
VTGRPLASVDWAAYKEPTCSAIVRELLAGDAKAEEKEEKIRIEFCRLLKEEQPKFPGDFSPIAGAIEFMDRLAREKICSVAISTGCFADSAAFKLECCGIRLDRFPHATASDTERRKDIISMAARRAGFDLSSAIYFADGPWDVRASAELGIPMIGIGRRWKRLHDLGVRYAFRDYSNPDEIIEAMNNV